MKRLTAFCVLLGLAFCLSGLTAGAKGDKKAEAKPRNYEVRMTTADQFDQKDIEIQAGDTVTWVNASAKQHSATADDGSEVTFTEVVVPAGKFSKRVAFDKKGKVKYHCKFHATMTGTITVK
jgi:plastocyanin